jgi:hypothetical protein
MLRFSGYFGEVNELLPRVKTWSGIFRCKYTGLKTKNVQHLTKLIQDRQSLLIALLRLKFLSFQIIYIVRYN